MKEWSYSVRDISELLGICEQGAYKLIKSKNIKTVNVDHWIRVQKDSFDRWYFRQEHYRSLEDREKEAVIEVFNRSHERRMPLSEILISPARDRILARHIAEHGLEDLLEKIQASEAPTFGQCLEETGVII